MRLCEVDSLIFVDIERENRELKTPTPAYDRRRPLRGGDRPPTDEVVRYIGAHRHNGGRNLGDSTTRSRRDRSAPKFELEVDESDWRRQAQLAEGGLGSTQDRERLPASTLFEQHRCGVDVERVVVGVDLDGPLD